MTTTHKWHESHDNLVRLAEALSENSDLLSADETIKFFSKPWHWDAEWAWLEQHGTMEGFGERNHQMATKKKPKLPTEQEMSDYLFGGGWLQGNSGWWHPPNCLASWPLVEAYEAAKRDEAKGIRMSAERFKTLAGVRLP